MTAPCWPGAAGRPCPRPFTVVPASSRPAAAPRCGGSHGTIYRPAGRKACND